MKTKYIPGAIAAAFIALTIMSADSIGRQAVTTAASGTGEPPRVSFTVKTAQDITDGWPKAAREAARSMLAKYGAPETITDESLLWRDTGGWLEIIVRKAEINHRFPVPHKDVLEQIVAYEVPEDKFDDLARFNGSITADRTRGTLSSRCEDEAMNLLALNLAHDVITNRRTVEEAREIHADIVRSYLKGESHPYMSALRFQTARVEETADPDYPQG